ncbi:hypothetical protein CLV24_10424 [Pontibacter ummariensis]|uniref:Uncharacterized protein n=1 Tax=Pontibacter ummariensis TaxID=1610492 RepID=A0A239D4T8_9BACT|nr:hypothetical protein [Pontibacter ummariensis]PRY14214.1 hypothetical protein CLV24_10424 [Pontibacter ummariensis]SNS26623.1 hypothetical protein SAMN06296052_10424 [Pontibacter ummariensis]
MTQYNDPLHPKHLPLYRKGQEIYEITAKIVELIPTDDEAQAIIRPLLIEDAAMLSVKVVSAEAADLYDLRMENAAIIRKAARDLLAHCTGLEMFGFKEAQYLHLIREAVEAYRLLFIEWVKDFDQWNYVVDKWGLFNPPGIDVDTSEDDMDNDI